MAKTVHDQVMRSLQEVEGLYHRLVLVVGSAGAGKTDVLRAIAKELGATVTNVNLQLASELLELTAKQRSVRLPGILNEMIDQLKSPLVLDNLEILFDKSLHQDPLRLLQGLSRNRTVVAAWNGSLPSGRLQYAEPGHPEYRSYDTVDVILVDLEGKTSVSAPRHNREVGQS